jgi:lysophospholipase L1-like esterase
MGWYCSIDAQGGTGYINDGHNNSPTNAPFAARLGDDRKFRADIVIVDGGRNDGNHTAAEVVTAATTYLEQVHATWPQAPIVVIVPIYVESTPETYRFGMQFANGIKPVVQRYGGAVIDPLNERWINPAQVSGFRWTDGIHPNVAGTEYLAQRLTAALKADGFDRLPVTDDRPISQGCGTARQTAASAPWVPPFSPRPTPARRGGRFGLATRKPP